VQCAVELAVAAAVEAVAVGAIRGGRDRRRIGEAPGDPDVAGDAARRRDLADQLGGGEHAAAALCPRRLAERRAAPTWSCQRPPVSARAGKHLLADRRTDVYRPAPEESRR
jgi:hypothetical protein